MLTLFCLFRLSCQLGPTPWLDGKHFVFGRVLSGFDETLLRAAEEGSADGEVRGSVTISDCGVL